MAMARIVFDTIVEGEDGLKIKFESIPLSSSKWQVMMYNCDERVCKRAQE